MKTGCVLAGKGVHLHKKHLPSPRSSFWECSPVVVRALGDADWYPRSGQAVDLPCDFGTSWFTSLHFPPAVSVILIYTIPSHISCPKGQEGLVPQCLCSACLCKCVRWQLVKLIATSRRNERV